MNVTSLKAKLVVRPRLLTVLLAVYFLAALNIVFINKVTAILTAQDTINIGFVLTIPLFLLATMVFTFSLFIWPYVTKPFFIFCLLTGAGVNYGAYHYGIIFNKDMMQNIFETTGAEGASYFNAKLFIWLFLTGVLPAALLAFTKIEYKKPVKEVLDKVVTMVVCVAVVGAIAAVYYKDYASLARNNPKIQKDIVPTYYLASAVKYVKAAYFTQALPYQKVGEDAVRVIEPDKEKYLIFFVVGETARAQNYQLNGYDRPTNAYTASIPNLVSFRNVTSCGTATAVSLPCMFSLLGKEDYSQAKADSHDNVLDILKRSGIEQVWIDNNTGCKGVCRSIANQVAINIHDLKCEDEECTDDVMLNVLDDKIKDFKGDDGVVYLHLLGSHGPTYYKRYPKNHATFQPDCQTSDLHACTDEQIINSYDNTILFTDYLIAQLIKKLKTYSSTYHAVLFYVSDHGESLGENGVYLHGMPYPVAPDSQTHVPLFMWVSDQFIKHEDLDMGCLRQEAATKSFSHDNIAPTLLSLLDIETNAYVSEKDILRPCVHD